MFKHRKMRFNGEWSLLAGNRVYELSEIWIKSERINEYDHHKEGDFEILRYCLEIPRGREMWSGIDLFTTLHYNV